MNSWRLTLIFSFSLFVSASLLFSIQPMVSKMLLPVLGGSPAVWTTAMVFFQGALLAGYAYAFAAAKYLPVKRQIVIHMILLIVAVYVLPITISDTWADANVSAPQFWLLTVLLAVVGLPFIAIAGSTTLLQNWFTHSGHETASDPYYLYAASNAGSLFALLAYPTIIEPFLTLDQQADYWSVAYFCWIALILN